MPGEQHSALSFNYSAPGNPTEFPFRLQRAMRKMYNLRYNDSEVVVTVSSETAEPKNGISLSIFNNEESIVESII